MTEDALDGMDDPLGLGVGQSDAPDDDASHLEIDDFQTKEIRQIFLATLPDYLEPVKQMVEQLFAGGEGREDLQRTLDTTLSSIADAASRVDISDVAAAAKRVRARIARIEDPVEEEIRDAIWSELADIERIAALDSGGSGPARSGASAQTIVAAFQNIEGLDRSTLEQLTAAGLVTVDQIRMADPSEIVAVTGLERSAVDALVRALVPDAGVSRTSGSALVEGSNADPLAGELERQLRRQVDAEVELAETRGRILQLQVTAAALKEELAAADALCSELRGQIAAKRRQVAERLARLGAERARRDRLERRRDDAARSLERAETDLEDLRRERASINDAQADLSHTVGDLIARVQHMLQAAESVEYELGMPGTSDTDFNSALRGRQ